MNTEQHPSVNTERLIDLYNRTSKHGQYQLLAAPLSDLLSSDSFRVRSNYEVERLAFILKNTPWQGASIADIGGNTGFFSLELLARGAESALYIEGNRDHSEFVKEAISLLGWQDHIAMRPQYCDFDKNLSMINVDICLLLNVMHHIGDDFGDGGKSVESAKNTILEALLRLARHTRFLAFQFGFNWQGNTKLPLFNKGTKEEMIDYVREGTKDAWKINVVGIAERIGTRIAYQNLTRENVRRDDSLGEFLNRPLFIMESCES